jgi:hypothetical protein
MSMKNTNSSSNKIYALKEVLIDRWNNAPCVDNSDTLQEAKALGKLPEDDIDCRIKRYSKCLSQCSKITASGLLTITS